MVFLDCDECGRKCQNSGVYRLAPAIGARGVFFYRSRCRCCCCELKRRDSYRIPIVGFGIESNACPSCRQRASASGLARLLAKAGVLRS